MKVSEKDREQMAMALERSVAEKGAGGGGDDEGDTGGDDDVGLLKSVIRAQHTRITDLKVSRSDEFSESAFTGYRSAAQH